MSLVFRFPNQREAIALAKDCAITLRQLATWLDAKQREVTAAVSARSFTVCRNHFDPLILHSSCGVLNYVEI